MCIIKIKMVIVCVCVKEIIIQPIEDGVCNNNNKEKWL